MESLESMKLQPLRLTSLLLPLLSFSFPRAEVASASAHGFKVTIQVQIDSSPGRVYNTVVKEVGAWWHPDHAFYGEAGKFSIEDRPNGCFCERSGKGQVRHMTVIFAEPGRVLRMTGALGPLQELGVTGNMGFKFSEAEGGTRVEFYYAVGGYSSQDLDQLAPIVDGVLSEQLERLKRYVETGSPSTQ